MRHSGMPNWAVGLILVIVLAILSLYAFTKTIPFVSNPYEVKVVFDSAANVRVTAPVRIAGVNVGEVTDVQPLTSEDEELQAAADGAPGGDEQASGQQAAIVTMEIKDDGLPIKEDATFKLRPRLFLEGNLFVQVRPGTPNAPEAEDGHVFPADQTSYAVQLDQVLTTLQSDVRKNLQTFLDQLGNALIKYNGAEGFRALYKSSGGAFRYTSEVNEAVLGTEPHDLSGLVKNLDSTVRALDQNETALQDLVTNLRVFTGAFAAEDASLERAIAELPRVMDAARPAFANLNAAFPPLRAFAREALPGVRSTPAALDAANPFINQLRKLMRPSELRGLVAGLRPTIPDLARLTRRTIPFLDESRALSSCFNEVVIPWSNDTVDPPPGYNLPIGGRVFEETATALAGTGAESRGGDANGQTQKVLGAGGLNTVAIPAALNSQAQDLFALTPFPIEGAVPRLNDSDKTPFRPDVACETQDPPNLGAIMGTGPTNIPLSAQQQAMPQSVQRPLTQFVDLLRSSRRVTRLREDGERSEARSLAQEIAGQIDRVTGRYQDAIANLGGGG
jgi:ABC-type transporter Mla subunit MlaD